MNETTNRGALVTAAYRKQQGMPYRAFADALNAHLVNTSVTHATVQNWEKGCTDPSTDFLLTCLVVYTDWRADWAVECLCAKMPEVFAPAIDHRMVMLTSRVVAMESISQGE